MVHIQQLTLALRSSGDFYVQGVMPVKGGFHTRKDTHNLSGSGQDCKWRLESSGEIAVFGR